MKTKEDLVNRLINQFVSDAVSRPYNFIEGEGDVTVLEELLLQTPMEKLINCLDECEWDEYKHLSDEYIKAQLINQIDEIID